ncbi:hypothetical protein ACFU7Y_38310, partial [Kitasatospora sp. NPDC057542]|uniref:hypothetical protein n=1 Tax=Kitasatospora sp. NPDC057542 TaxID=3346162 RepID=UPI0036C8B0D1
PRNSARSASDVLMEAAPQAAYAHSTPIWPLATAVKMLSWVSMLPRYLSRRRLNISDSRLR